MPTPFNIYSLFIFSCRISAAMESSYLEFTPSISLVSLSLKESTFSPFSTKIPRASVIYISFAALSVLICESAYLRDFPLKAKIPELISLINFCFSLASPALFLYCVPLLQYFFLSANVCKNSGHKKA